jgi:hypothetical protein
MPPRRHEQLQQVDEVLLEEPARQLHNLLQSPAATQLLQQPPPDAVSTQEQYNLLSPMRAHLMTVRLGCEQNHRRTAPGRVLGLLLRQHAAHSAGTLVAWLQQRPEQLRLDELPQRPVGSTATAAALWVEGCECLMRLALAHVAAVEVPQQGCNAVALAAAMLQQLHQSGMHLARVLLGLHADAVYASLHNTCLIVLRACAALSLWYCTCRRFNGHN